MQQGSSQSFRALDAKPVPCLGCPEITGCQTHAAARAVVERSMSDHTTQPREVRRQQVIVAFCSRAKGDIRLSLRTHGIANLCDGCAAGFGARCETRGEIDAAEADARNDGEDAEFWVLDCYAWESHCPSPDSQDRLYSIRHREPLLEIAEPGAAAE